jgi:acetyl-CoA carboxylase/biotin carboxylase 1
MIFRYADILSRGGVLEPEGTVEIKFRSRELIKAMRRLDPQVKTLAEKLSDPALDQLTKSNLESELLLREQALLPIYTQVTGRCCQAAEALSNLGRSSLMIFVI